MRSGVCSNDRDGFVNPSPLIAIDLIDQVNRLQGRVAMLEGELNGKAVQPGAENGAEKRLGADGDEASRSEVAAE